MTKLILQNVYAILWFDNKNVWELCILWLASLLEEQQDDV